MYTNVRSISAKTLKYITVGGLKFHLAVMYKNRHVVHALMCASPCIQFYFGAGKSLRDNFPKGQRSLFSRICIYMFITINSKIHASFFALFLSVFETNYNSNDYK